MTTNFKQVLVLLGSRYNHIFHRGIAAYASRTRWHLTVSGQPVGSPITVPKSIHGVLIADDFPDSDLEPFIKAEIPTVSLLARPKEGPFSLVIGDNRGLGRIAGEHFRERGFRNFAFFGPNSLWSNLRMEGFREVVMPKANRFLNIDTPSAAKKMNLDWEHDKQILSHTLRNLVKPCAVFCANDPLACRVLDVCLELGRQVPEEVAILGVDNDPLYCGSVAIPLSSVIHDLQSIGYKAAEELERLMKGAPTSQQIIMPLGIVTRRSTDHKAVENPSVLAALRFIEEHYSRNIGVTDVAEGVSAPLRTLQHLFRKELDESVVDCIKRIRLAKAQEWLARPSVPVAEVAARCGFSSSEYFHRVFKSQLGCTPQEFRSRRGTD
jgi:LacI family transcriptional regulator